MDCGDGLWIKFLVLKYEDQRLDFLYLNVGWLWKVVYNFSVWDVEIGIYRISWLIRLAELMSFLFK